MPLSHRKKSNASLLSWQAVGIRSTADFIVGLAGVTLYALLATVAFGHALDNPWPVIAAVASRAAQHVDFRALHTSELIELFSVTAVCLVAARFAFGTLPVGFRTVRLHGMRSRRRWHWGWRLDTLAKPALFGSFDTAFCCPTTVFTSLTKHF